MRQRAIMLEADASQASTLARSISAYAKAAFPEGGSECAQASREALLETAHTCQQHAGGELTLRKRQLGLIRAALRWYAQEHPDDAPNHVAELRQALERQPPR